MSGPTPTPPARASTETPNPVMALAVAEISKLPLTNDEWGRLANLAALLSAYPSVLLLLRTALTVEGRDA